MHACGSADNQLFYLRFLRLSTIPCSRGDKGAPVGDSLRTLPQVYLLAGEWPAQYRLFMSKKRPRHVVQRPAWRSKQEPQYWRRRLFKGRYTYKGKQFEVRNWSVKIQHLGKRKTFSLRSSRRKPGGRRGLRTVSGAGDAGLEGCSSSRRPETCANRSPARSNRRSRRRQDRRRLLGAKADSQGIHDEP